MVLRKTGTRQFASMFPQLSNNDGGGFGKQMSNQFSAYLKKRGVTESGLGMYVFRHTLATRLARAKVPLQTIGKITSNKGEQGTPGKFYSDEPTLQERLYALELFEANVGYCPGIKVGSEKSASKHRRFSVPDAS